RGGDEVDERVVRLIRAREVLAAVVDHLVGTERAHEVELAGIVDARDMRTAPLGELDRETARAATTAVDKHAGPVPRSDRSLQRDRGRLGDRRRLRERQR